MSLRARVLIGMAVIALVLGASAVVITRTTEAHLIDQVDEQLSKARPGPDFGGREGYSSLYFAQVNGDEITTISRAGIGDDVLPSPEIDIVEVQAAERDGDIFTVGSEGSDLRYRVRASEDPFTGSVFVVALPLGDVDDAIHRLIWVEVIATVAVLAALALVTWWVIHLGVRPIKRMTKTAAAIAGGDLSQRVAEGTRGTEAAELGTALNQMLGRIEASFDERVRSEERLRQFVADASHELRTPVTTIRGYAELYRVGGLESGDDLSEAMRRTEQEAVRMGALVDDLLHLARLDQGRLLEREPVDLSAIVDDAVRDARAVDPDRPIAAEVEPDVRVLGDDGRLRQVVANLLGNAIVHTPPGTAVEVSTARSGDRAVVIVTDHGPGMSEEAASRAFERFYREDPSRSRHRGGSGLGLAIVEATLHAHGGEVTLSSRRDVGTTVRVELPALRDGRVPVAH
jgi:two-component system, OmpR family, sensor kinase